MMTGTKILLIEDNAEDVELTLRALKKYNATTSIHVVRDGEEALDWLFSTDNDEKSHTRESPCLIVLDLKLPKVDGLEVLQRCKSDSRTKNIPVVVLTSSREEPDLLQSYNLGANSYIVKPVGLPQFTETVRQLGLYWMMFNQLPLELCSQVE